MADESAGRIIDAAQRIAVGEASGFTIARAEETLRERLLIEQDLPVSASGSVGTAYIDRVEHWPDEAYLEGRVPAGVMEGEGDEDALVLTLVEALAVAAENSRAFQLEKERVFLAALDLDLAREEFRLQPSAGVSGEAVADLGTDPEETVGFVATPELSFSENLENGATVTGALGADLVRLLTLDEGSSLAFFGDASVTVPLLRGSGRHIVREPLTQAERDTIYAIFGFERFKRSFVVDIVSEYLGVLQALDQRENARRNYESLIISTRRLRRLAEEGRVPQVDVDQAVQDELRARNSWISARQGVERAYDGFRQTLGLPTDAEVFLDESETERLLEAVASALDGLEVTGAYETGEGVASARPAGEGGADAPVRFEPPSRAGAGPYEFEEPVALRIALGNRLDLRRVEGEVADAQRRAVVAADGLRAELTIGGSVSVGERRTSVNDAGLDDSRSLRFDEGSYRGLLTLDLPIDRLEERVAYRASLIDLERAVRDLQSFEDSVKAEIRERLRTLLTSREGLRIQAAAVRLAERRVESTRLLLDIGRAETRDLLEAQEDLLAAQNAFTSALVSYRVAELAIQRDMGVLSVSNDGLWTEFDPSRAGALASEGRGAETGREAARRLMEGELAGGDAAAVEADFEGLERGGVMGAGAGRGDGGGAQDSAGAGTEAM